MHLHLIPPLVTFPAYPFLCPLYPPSQATLREFLDAEGKALSDSTKDDPPLSKFEEQIAKYKALSGEISALPSLQTMGWVKVNAKPLRTALSTWVSKWTNLFTQYLQEKVGGGMGTIIGGSVGGG